MLKKPKIQIKGKKGLAIVIVVVSIVILALLGIGVMAGAYGVRYRAIQQKNESIAMLAAEAGYEKAVFWMSQQQDMLYTLKTGGNYTDSLNFTNSNCDYSVSFYTFIHSRPVYKIVSVGQCGHFSKTVDVKVVQAISGWDMGMCRVPSGATSTSPVNYANGEIIDMPIHINKLNDSPDEKDIYITGSPRFLQVVEMGEKRYTSGGADKYSSVMGLFEDGIYFDQPDSQITNESTVQKKIDRFRDSTKAQFIFNPVASAPVSNPRPAVHLEFFVQNGIGKIRITNNCTVRGFMQGADSRTWDFRITPGSGGTQYQRYYIYAYHLMPSNADSTGERFIVNMDQTYVTQSFGSVESEPGGQIYVNGNVIIGSGDPTLPGNQDTINGKITIVATGNIWIADSIVVDGVHDAGGLPSNDNPNVLGLIAQGVIRVVDPGMSDYTYVDDTPVQPSGYTYIPIGQHDGGSIHLRHLPDPTVIEAAITVGGGGWGAENVARSSYGGRKEFSGSQDQLIIRGAIAEAVRGVVGLVGSDGYLKYYYLDERLLEGVLPGDIWLKGKYIPSPAGWHDYRI